MAYDMTLHHRFIHELFPTIICETDKRFLPFLWEYVIFKKIRSSVGFHAAWDMANVYTENYFLKFLFLSLLML